MKRALIIDHHTKHLDQLRSLIPCETEIVEWDKMDIDSNSHYDIIILSGGSGVPPVAEYPEAYAKERALIRSTTIPLIGICLGCELIAHEFGATIGILDNEKKGFVSIDIHPPFDSFFPQKNIVAYEAHTRTIETLPTELQIVASSNHGSEIIRHRHRPIWGFQFHPEHLTERTLGDEVFLTVLRKCFQQ